MASQTQTSVSKPPSPTDPSPSSTTPASIPFLPPSLHLAQARRSCTLQTTAHNLILTTALSAPFTSGAYLEYYYTTRPLLSLSQLAAVFALQIVCLFIAYGPALWLYQKGFWRSVAGVAASVVVAGQFALPACISFPALLLVQGVAIGTGFGVLGSIATFCTASHYRNNVPLASMMGVPYAFLGAIVYTAILHVGFQMDSLVVGTAGCAGVSLTLLLPALFMLRRSKAYVRFEFGSGKGTGRWKFMGEGTLAFVVGYCWVFMGVFEFPVFMVLMVSSKPGYAWPGEGTKVLMGMWAAGVVGAAEGAARWTRLAFGPVNSFLVAAIAAGICFLNPGWMPYTHVAWPCAILYGFALGVILAVHMKVTTVFHWSKVVWHPDMMLRMVVFMTLASLSAGAGIITTAVIIERGEGDFAIAMTLPGCTTIAGGILILWARYKRGGKFFMVI